MVILQKDSEMSLTRQDTSVMKGIAIIAMLLHHLYGVPIEVAAPCPNILQWLGALGKVCVALFLFCSGYGLAAQYKQTSIKDDVKFTARRLVKFYANYWAVFVLFVPISIFVYHRTLTVAYGGEANVILCFIKDIFGVQGWQSYNITWWFNELIIILYLIFPLLYRIIHKLPWVVIIGSIILMRFSDHIPFNPIEICLWQFPFVLGISWKVLETTKINEKIDRFKVHKLTFGISTVIICSLCIVVRMWSIIPHWSGVRIDGMVACAVVLMIIGVLRYMPHVMTILSFIGKHSMNIYMTHTFFVLYWYPKWFIENLWMRQGISIFVLMGICLIISIMIEFLKEKTGINTIVKTITSKIN
jgi:hypothetical protein